MKSIAAVQESDWKASYVFVGDFTDWLLSVSPTNINNRAVLNFASTTGCQHLVVQPAHCVGNLLDFLLTDIPVIVNVTLCLPLGLSDHSSLQLTLQVHQPVLIFTVA